jgi:hypothetical protein
MNQPPIEQSIEFMPPSIEAGVSPTSGQLTPTWGQGTDGRAPLAKSDLVLVLQSNAHAPRVFPGPQFVHWREPISCIERGVLTLRGAQDERGSS